MFDVHYDPLSGHSIVRDAIILADDGEGLVAGAVAHIQSSVLVQEATVLSLGVAGPRLLWKRGHLCVTNKRKIGGTVIINEKEKCVFCQQTLQDAVSDVDVAIVEER